MQGDIIVHVFLLMWRLRMGRGSCRNLVFRSRVTDKALTGFVFKKINVNEESICRTNCFIESNRCLSYNYNTNSRTCELSESDHVMHQANLVDQPGSVYNAAKNKCKCSKNEICYYDFTSTSFRCTCNVKFGGSNCTVRTPTTQPETTTALSSTEMPTTYQPFGVARTEASPTGTLTTQQDTTTKASTTDCELYFPGESSIEYVEIHSAFKQEVTSFSLNFWIKPSSSYGKTFQIFSYHSTDDSSDFSLRIKEDGVAEIMLNGGGKSLQTNLARDDTWQNFIIAWSNKNGLVRLFKNGIQQSTESDMQRGKKVKSGGTMYLGQKHKKDGFDKVIKGKIADLEIWKDSITNETAAKIYKFKCQSAANDRPGDLLTWKAIVDSKYSGDVTKNCPATCPS